MLSVGFLIALLLHVIYAQERFQFGNHFYNHVTYHKPKDNLAVSPLAFEYLLTQVYVGAKKQSERELGKVLLVKTPTTKSEVIDRFSEFYKRTMEPYKETLISKNILIVNRKLYYVRNFKKTIEDHFDTRVDKAFILTGKQIFRKLNSWFEKKTDNKITNVFGPDSMNVDSAVISANGMYFKDKWLYAFNEIQTTTEEYSELPMMTNYGLSVRYGHLPNSNVEVVQLPFQSGLNMVIFLPPKNRLPELELRLLTDFIDIPKFVQNLEQLDAVAVTIPKFRIEFDLDLKPILNNMGVEQLFHDADLSSMVKPGFEWKNNLYISSLLHKVVVEVDEDGVEQIDEKINGTQRPHFIANRPFMFAICDSQNVHFYGRMVDL